jgi:pyruvate carboxylase
MPVVDGNQQRLDALGPKDVADWMRGQKRVLMTDTTMRDGHQSLLATRMRTHDIDLPSPVPMRGHLPELLSLECWGGATFDVSMRFLHRGCPWERLEMVRQGCAEPALADAAARVQWRWLQELSR